MSWNIAKPGDQINGPVAVTGNLNVDSNTLFVDSANNRVGVLTASPTVPLDVVGDAKVSGNLTVDTNTLVVNAANNFVGINTSTPIANLDVRASNGVGAVFLRTTDPSAAVASAYIQTPVSTGHSATSVYGFWYQNTGVANPSAETLAINTNANERLRIASDGVCTWSNVGGVAGTAMTLNGTGLGVGVSPATKLHIAGTGTQTLKIQTNTSGNPTLALEAAGQDGASMFFNRSGNYFGIGISGIATAVAINTSGNVGIGTATPSVKVQVDNNGQSEVRIRNTSGSGIAALALVAGAQQSNPWYLYADSSRNLIFQDGGSERARIDSTGNLGLGVTPDTKFDVALAGAGTPRLRFTSASDDAILESQRWAGSGSLYLGTRLIHSGGFYFQTAPAAAVGSQTFTTRMVLDASGNLLVGTASVLNSGKVTVYQSGNGQCYVAQVSNNGYSNFQGFNSSGTATFYATGDGDVTLGSISRYGTSHLSINVNGAERLRIKSTGQVNFVGQASDPAGASAGDVYYNTTTNKLKCYNGTTWNDLF